MCDASGMTARVEHGWARSGELDIAYEVHGDAPVDLVVVPGLLNTLLSPLIARRFALADEALCRFVRLIKLDKRGTGLSDRFPTGTTPTVEERMDDVRAVMDAVGSERACVLGAADGGPVAMMFAASHPERVSSLILESTSPRTRWGIDWPWGQPDDARDVLVDLAAGAWGTGVMADVFGTPSDERRREYAALERIAGTPSAVVAMIEALRDTDVRDVLPLIAAPTLVVHHAKNPVWPPEASRYLAEHIADARLIEESGGDGPFDLLTSSPSERLAVIEEFVTGIRPPPPVERVLKTVLFTDIVDSTARLATMGDRGWREVLDAHDTAIRDALARHDGREINTTGDGFLAAFDGPARAIRCAQTITTEGRDLGIDLRTGIHTGECELRGEDLAGIAVHIGARVAALADGGEVLVTGTVRDLVAGSGIEFDARGRHALKGVPGEWELLVVRE
jgi:class 3 adenylate cyclase/alpha-beta hydrolase superfamily lysophospholipase